MKKILLIIVLFALVSFIPKNGTYYDVTMLDNENGVFMKSIEIDGMQYAIFFKKYRTSPFVINLTKDKLECEYYKKELSKK